MNKLLSCLIGTFFLTLATPAFGQATRTWVSGVGDDANPCSRTAPCKTFAGAISKTATNGEINCLDSAGFGGVTITKSITIDCHTEHGGVLALNFNGVIVNGVGAEVTLRGLYIQGAGGTSGNGIRIIAASQVNIDDCVMENFAGTTAGNGSGISIGTSAANTRIYVTDSHVINNNNFGIHSNPTAGNVVLFVDGSQISNGGSTGIQLRQLTTAFINNTQITGNAAGAGIALELTSVTAHVSNSFIANNNFGIFSGNGGTPTTRIYGNVITGNATDGLSIVGGTITSYGNNAIRGNNGNEAPSGVATGTQ
jgi:hypothetical protein